MNVHNNDTLAALNAIEARIGQLTDIVARLTPQLPLETNWAASDAFTFDADLKQALPIRKVNRVDLNVLCAIDYNKQQLLDNTLRFANGYAANNALLWGAKGMGKSSLVKAVHAHVNRITTEENNKYPLKLVEIHREDISALPYLLSLIRQSDQRFIVYCDDLSFDDGDSTYKSLKSALDGGLEGRPENTLFYASSNRRHLLPRQMMENERSTAINPADSVNEKLSLADRFGLWLGFHNCTQDEYLDIIKSYLDFYGFKIRIEDVRQEALAWATTRGARSGRVAYQFLQDLAGRHKRSL
ncbi:ATP-binding protein [Polycladidibacter stylochi]|uniref:ATP-binding protein n=1 Tax=Polycladidibacter stylochi TaxID=1807766 RepID=UPI0008320E90|nr:ATP-binding protein [Pseudovibrio stylochi]